MIIKKIAYLPIVLISLLFLSSCTSKNVKNVDIQPRHEVVDYEVGDVVDTFNNVSVYYNGEVVNISGRSTSESKYNFGLKYQCVEFVKRYYYEHLNHEMPDTFGNAKDFFDQNIKDGVMNKRRDLIQYTNGSKTKPEVDDLVIFGPKIGNAFGHVAIISNVKDDEIEIIQQNPGPSKSSREVFPLKEEDDKYIIEKKTILGWLRKSKED